MRQRSRRALEKAQSHTGKKTQNVAGSFRFLLCFSFPLRGLVLNLPQRIEHTNFVALSSLLRWMALRLLRTRRTRWKNNRVALSKKPKREGNVVYFFCGRGGGEHKKKLLFSSRFFFSFWKVKLPTQFHFLRRCRSWSARRPRHFVSVCGTQTESQGSICVRSTPAKGCFTFRLFWRDFRVSLFDFWTRFSRFTFPFLDPLRRLNLGHLFLEKWNLTLLSYL